MPPPRPPCGWPSCGNIPHSISGPAIITIRAATSSSWRCRCRCRSSTRTRDRSRRRAPRAGLRPGSSWRSRRAFWTRSSAAWRASQPEQREARRLRAAARLTLARRRADFAAGLIGRLRLIGAEQALIQAEQGTLAAAVDERRALGELEAALYHRFL